MKRILMILLMMITVPAFSADSTTTPPPHTIPAPNPKPGDKPAPTPKRISIFSTSTDWEGLTGLQLAQYSGEFIHDSKLIGKGLVLYYLDGFPCYGLGYGVRVWLGPGKKHDGDLHIACLYPPTELKFTWRNALRDADEAVSTGILTCPVSGDRHLIIDLSKCTKGKDWSEYK